MTSVMHRLIHPSKLMDLVDDLVASVHDAQVKDNYRMAPQHDRIYAELEEFAEDLKKPPWVSVLDGFPDDGQEVIYYFAPIGMAFGKYDKAHNVFYGKLGFLTGDVTHWMPKPRIPE